jgi:hypothetical protein
MATASAAALHGLPAGAGARWARLAPVRRSWAILDHVGLGSRVVWRTFRVDRFIGLGVQRMRRDHPTLALAALEGLSEADAELYFRVAARWSKAPVYDVMRRVTPACFVRAYKSTMPARIYWPALAALSDEALVSVCERISEGEGVKKLFHVERHAGQWEVSPIPAQLVPGIHRGLNLALIRAGRAGDIPFLRELASVRHEQQRDYFKTAVVDPERARVWADSPVWVRELLDGDAEAERIWTAIQRLLDIVREPIGVHLQWLAGAMFGADPARARWRTVIWSLGHELESGAVKVDDLRRAPPPWSTLAA